MGILSRFKDIMASNINALLDKAEDPEKMCDQYLRDLNDDLAKVKSETATVMAEEQRAKRQLDDIKQEIADLGVYAERAVVAGNDDDAKAFLQRKAALAPRLEAQQKNYDMAVANSEKMRNMYDKLNKDIKELEARREELKSKMTVAKAQERINELSSTVSSSNASISAFEAMEEKVNMQLDKVNAMTELSQDKDALTIKELEAKYSRDEAISVDDELAAIKARLGK